MEQTVMNLDTEGEMNLKKLLWLRDERYAALRLYCCWRTGLKARPDVQTCLNFWAAGRWVYKSHGDDRDRTAAELGLSRHNSERAFDDLILRTVTINTALCRAEQQPATTADGLRKAWFLRWYAINKLGCPDVRIADAPPPRPTLVRKNRRKKHESSSEESTSSDSGDDDAKRTAEAEGVWRDAAPVGVVSSPLKESFTKAQYEVSSAERTAALERLILRHDGRLFPSSAQRVWPGGAGVPQASPRDHHHAAVSGGGGR
jgi:hypothetical protein